MSGEQSSGRPPAIQVQGLRKAFEGVQAVDQVSFQVEHGEVFGFLGPNGAGKTTTINMLTGLARPDAGSIVIEGEDGVARPKAVQHLIGVVPDESNLYPEMNGFENLCFCASLYGMERTKAQDAARRLLKEFDLDKPAKRRFGGYSKGMKRKLAIAAGIIHQPRILFLDEPTSGIDVASARQIRERIRGLNQQGCTVFLTTHYLEEAERLCHRIAFIAKGRLIKVDSLANLMQGHHSRSMLQLSLERADQSLCTQLEQSFPGLECRLVSGSEVRVEAKGELDIAPLVQRCRESGRQVWEAKQVRPSLEEVFVQVTGLDTQQTEDGLK